MNRTITIRVVTATVVLLFTAATWTQSGQLTLSWLKLFSVAVSSATVILITWDLWLWRIPIVQLIPGVPRNIRGTWQGKLETFWTDPISGNQPPTKVVYLVVRQTATLVTTRMLTNESRSSSSLAAITASDGSSELAYVYLNRPNASVEHRSRMHHGSTVLDITGSPATRLHGRYWTDRDTKGELDFTHRNRNLSDDFESAEKLFARDN